MPKYVLKIIKDPEKLSSRCDEITVTENVKSVTRVVSELKDTLKANPDLMALAAPQIGENVRAFCIKFSDGDIKSFVNPMITKVQGKCIMIEKDPTNGKEYMMQRPERILVGYQTPTGKVETDLSFKNPLASLFDQMIDIIDGTLFFKYLTLGVEIDDNYYKAPQDQKDELHKWYLDTYIPSRIKELETLAKNDEDINKTREAISFLTSMINGETEVVPTFDNELDFEHSSLKIKEQQDKAQKAYEEAVKKKYGIK